MHLQELVEGECAELALAEHAPRIEGGFHLGREGGREEGREGGRGVKEKHGVVFNQERVTGTAAENNNNNNNNYNNNN